MSEKHASEKTPTVNLDEIATREANSASDALFDEFSQGARNLFRGGLQLAERVHDSAAGFFAFGNENAVENHTKRLEKEAANALKRGDLSAAKHFIKRDIAFTMGTQGYDDDDSQRLLKELKGIETAEKLKAKVTAKDAHAAPEQKKVNQMTAALAKVMLAG